MNDCSVIIPCYNQGQFLQECLDSIFAQTQKPCEIILVNDGSTDEVSQKIFDSGVLDNTVKLITHPVALGLSVARNSGIQQARGTYILPVDADDKIAPNYIEHGTAILRQNPKIGIVSGDVIFFGTRSGKAGFSEFSKWRMTIDNCIISGSIFRKSDWERIGGYCADFKDGLEDWDFYLSLLENGFEYHHLNEIVYYYRQHAASMTNRLKENSKKQEHLYRCLLERHKKYIAEYAHEALFFMRSERIKFQKFGKHPLITLCRKFLRATGQYKN
jgi:glycosyltransferase involved in cell wall biosynthesis